MFFIFGMASKEKKLDFTQTIVCSNCGSYGRYEAFMTYSYFSLFFIPLLKWNKKYYIKSSCCGSLYSVDKDIGRRVERGENVNINESDLQEVNVNRSRVCGSCSYPVEDEFEYCPRCGERLN